MGARKEEMLLHIPVILPSDCSSVEVDYDQQGETGSQVYVTFKKDDGTRVVVKGDMPTISETGLTMALS